MNITQAVDRGLEVRKEIKKLQAELKGIEAFLETTGLKREHEDLKDSDREGRRWLARGAELIVPVIFTADKLVGSFTNGTELHQKIEAASCRRMGAFFKAVNGYKNKFDDGKKFRETAAEILGKDAAPPFITACLARDKQGVPVSDVKILWDETEVPGVKNREVIVEEMVHQVGQVLDGKAESYTSDSPVVPAMIADCMESLGWTMGELETNGWQYDWWLTFTKDGRSFTASGSGYYGKFKFNKTEVT